MKRGTVQCFTRRCQRKARAHRWPLSSRLLSSRTSAGSSRISSDTRGVLKRKLSDWMKAKDTHQPTGLIQRVVRRPSDPNVGREEAEKPLQNPDLFYSNLLNFLADLNASGGLVRCCLWIQPAQQLKCTHFSLRYSSTSIDTLLRRWQRDFSSACKG